MLLVIDDKRAGFKVARVLPVAPAWLPLLLKARDHQPVASEAAYVERYRWTLVISILDVCCVVIIGVMVVSRPPLILEVAVIAVFGWFAIVSAATGLSGKIAFSADARGVTFGGSAFRYSATTRFVPWADIEAVALWQRYVPFSIGRWTLVELGPVRYIGLRRHTSSRLATKGHRHSERPAYGAPAPGIAAGAARNITAWTLDRDRLAEALTAFAPTVAIEEPTSKVKNTKGKIIQSR